MYIFLPFHLKFVYLLLRTLHHYHQLWSYCSDAGVLMTAFLKCCHTGMPCHIPHHHIIQMEG